MILGMREPCFPWVHWRETGQMFLTRISLFQLCVADNCIGAYSENRSD